MTDRTQTPAEFFDRTSAQLLVKPEPQYIYNQLLMGALSAELPIPPGMGHLGRELTGVGAEYGNQGGTLALENDYISKEVFAATVDMLGEPGHTIRFNRPTFANTTYTEASRTVGANTTISTSPINIGSEQTSMTLKRFAGPYDQTNARVAPFALDGLDTQLGVHKASDIVGTHMRRDYHRFQDSVVSTLLDTGASLYPTGYSAVNDFTVAGGAPLSYEFVSYAESYMDSANLPVLPDGKRILVVPPGGKEALKTDPQFARLSEFHKELNALFPATYLTSIGQFHVFQSTTLSTSTSSSNVTVLRAHAIAPGALGVGMGKAPKVAYSNDDNYGETAKVIWIAYMAYALLDSSFVLNLRFTGTR